MKKKKPNATKFVTSFLRRVKCSNKNHYKLRKTWYYLEIIRRPEERRRIYDPVSNYVSNNVFFFLFSKKNLDNVPDKNRSGCKISNLFFMENNDKYFTERKRDNFFVHERFATFAKITWVGTYVRLG